MGTKSRARCAVDSTKGSSPKFTLRKCARFASAAICLIGWTCVSATSVWAQTLPSGWKIGDVGQPSVPGGATTAGSTFTVTSKGYDVNNSTDQFTFAYVPVSSDVSVVARVTGITNADALTQAGLMIRDGLSPAASHVFAFGTPGAGLAVRNRASAGSGTTMLSVGAITLPIWLKLERRSSVVNTFSSSDGKTWRWLRTLSVSSNQLLFGLAVASHSRATTAAATFDNVTINPLGGTTTPNAAPTILLNVDKTNYAAPASIVMTATATDTDGAVAKVDFYEGPTLVGSRTAGPFSLTWNGAPAGTHALKAIATDNQGAVATSGTVTVTVAAANNPPTVSILTDKATYKAPASLVMSAIAADSDGTVAGVEFYAGTTLVATDTTSPYSFTWSGVPSGIYVIRAMAIDNAGAVASSPVVNVTVAAANVAPTVSLTTDKTNYLAPGSVTVTAAAADSDGSVAKVDFYAGTTLLGTDSATPYTFSWGNVSAGSYILTAIATDNAGAATTSSPVSVTVNANTPPTISLTAPSNGTSFMAPASTTLAAVASDTNGSVTRVDFYAGSTLVGYDTTSPFSVPWTNVAAGSYVLKAIATDSAGASTTSAVVNVTVSANQAPTVSLTSPASGATFSAPATINLAASASDVDGTIQKVEFYNGSTLLGSSTTSPFSFNWQNVAAGSYSLSAVARDNLGGTAVSSWRDITVGATSALSKAIFTPAVVADVVEYYVFEVFAAGADPNVAVPVATQNLGVPLIINGQCAVDVKDTIAGLVPGSYVATVSSVSAGEGALRSAPVVFTR